MTIFQGIEPGKATGFLLVVLAKVLGLAARDGLLLRYGIRSR
jgi:hypothetical protein